MHRIIVDIVTLSTDAFLLMESFSQLSICYVTFKLNGGGEQPVDNAFHGIVKHLI
jgi:hypothetical protein